MLEDGYYYNGTWYPGWGDAEDGYYYNGTWYPGYETEDMYEREGPEQEDLMWWQLHHPRWSGRDGAAGQDWSPYSPGVPQRPPYAQVPPLVLPGSDPAARHSPQLQLLQRLRPELQAQGRAPHLQHQRGASRFGFLFNNRGRAGPQTQETKQAFKPPASPNQQRPNVSKPTTSAVSGATSCTRSGKASTPSTGEAAVEVETATSRICSPRKARRSDKPKRVAANREAGGKIRWSPPLHLPPPFGAPAVCKRTSSTVETKPRPSQVWAPWGRASLPWSRRESKWAVRRRWASSEGPPVQPARPVPEHGHGDGGYRHSVPGGPHAGRRAASLPAAQVPTGEAREEADVPAASGARLHRRGHHGRDGHVGAGREERLPGGQARGQRWTLGLEGRPQSRADQSRPSRVTAPRHHLRS